MKVFGSGLTGLGIGKIRIPGEPMRGPRLIPFQSRCAALTCSIWKIFDKMIENFDDTLRKSLQNTNYLPHEK
uniref:Uncharacterized protein n=1 Tax=Candidatus Kentrum sp. TUN TaxID=2126343 RepID=A0A451A6T5_9GAMM|nr:MAG: hypothetical protein BECKTUN1418F_GA0071002_12702 [Candidatus Kentron sp. TUN]VFK64923.1 MAG: hypothetical protein BECKTUN1418D_GA0071000_13002 [Candidatus Kentron sp. TUN]VFK71414.1 MAG: hypothetical protein BECKTUN1418E_GA0071001_12822 [Candidatus Kentron sp. TUN]